MNRAYYLPTINLPTYPTCYYISTYPIYLLTYRRGVGVEKDLVFVTARDTAVFPREPHNYLN